uniref:ATP-dependent DNA helicase n=1 Tax=Lactuca sativa TaxID=4236 RepID=A0A9R1VGG8_LACSA|nr:hypothetical protein LSAT_V11C500286960 [Lactuca sativa]
MTKWGGPRYMYSHYRDALSICREYGNPQYFITFTCNVNRPDIRRYMIHHTQTDAHSRVDIISHVFHIKVRALINFLKEDKTFGAVTAHLYTIEYQKRGLPHYHTLLWVCNSDKIQEATNITRFISAEIPDPVNEPLLYQTITTSMIHGPCGFLNIKCPCMKDGKCSKRYPKPFSYSTVIDKQGYAHYRRNTLARHTLQNGIEIDNGYVVPYNKRLCNRFNTHINVEYCGWNMMIKYLFKYVSKGMEREKFVIKKDVSRDGTTTSSQEIVVDEIRSFIGDVVHNVSFGSSLLLGWFENNKWDKGGLDLTYGTYPSKYITLHAIGRIAFVHPSDGELFYLRMLLFHQKGCKSYEDVRTIYNKLHPNFHSTCDALGLIGDDKEWLLAFTQASDWATSANPISLWETGWRAMSDDILYNLKKHSPNTKLCISDVHLQQGRKSFSLMHSINSVTDFNLPLPSDHDEIFFQNRLLLEETSYNRQELSNQHKLMVSCLNSEQLNIYNLVVFVKNGGKHVLFFIYGHGGTGKTFLWTTLLSYFHSIGKIALAVATSSIASLLLPSGRTAHSRCNIPIDFSNKSACGIKKKTFLAALFK